MPSISTVIITHNEETNIEQCLATVKPISDEIIVVDSFSTDRTPEICQSYPQVSFLQKPFTSHGDQKNFGISQAQFDYILSLDADELLSPELLNHLCLNKEHFNEDAYAFRRLNHLGKEPIYHGLWYPDEKIRLFKKTKATWESGVLHEKIILNPGAKLRRLPLHIHHYGYQNIDQFRERSQNYAQWWAQVHYGSGKKSGAFSPLFHAIWTFIRATFIKLAFLDGFTGLLIMVQNTKETYSKYKKLKALHKHGRV